MLCKTVHRSLIVFTEGCRNNTDIHHRKLFSTNYPQFGIDDLTHRCSTSRMMP